MLDIIIFLLPPFIACTILLGLMGYLGMHVLKREIIFIDIALAQIAAVGSTVAFVVFGFEDHSFLAYLCAFGVPLGGVYIVWLCGLFNSEAQDITRRPGI